MAVRQDWIYDREGGPIETIPLRTSEGGPRDEALVAAAGTLFDEHLSILDARFGRHVIAIGSQEGEYLIVSRDYHGHDYHNQARAFHELCNTLDLNPEDLKHDASRGLAGFFVDYASLGDTI